MKNYIRKNLFYLVVFFVLSCVLVGAMAYYDCFKSFDHPKLLGALIILNSPIFMVAFLGLFKGFGDFLTPKSTYMERQLGLNTEEDALDSMKSIFLLVGMLGFLAMQYKLIAKLLD